MTFAVVYPLYVAKVEKRSSSGRIQPMGFLFVTAIVSGVVIFLGASLLGWVFNKVAPDKAASLGHVATTVALVAVMTAVYVFVMTRPSVVGPYEQWTFANIAGQVLGGVLAGGLKIWTR